LFGNSNKKYMRYKKVFISVAISLLVKDFSWWRYHETFAHIVWFLTKNFSFPLLSLSLSVSPTLSIFSLFSLSLSPLVSVSLSLFTARAMGHNYYSAVVGGGGGGGRQLGIGSCYDRWRDSHGVEISFGYRESWGKWTR